MLSADRQRFLDAVRDSPDDDVPRLVFADWLDEHGDPDRAEFIRGQVRLAGMNEWDDGWTEQDVRCRSLLRRHGEDWLGDLGQFVPAWEDRRWPVFRRGFPERVTVDVETFLQHHDRLFRAGPVRGVRFAITDHVPWKLYEMPALARLTAAGLGPWAFVPSRLGYLGLPDCPHLAGLTELWLDNDLATGWWDGRRYTPAGEIVSSRFAGQLHTLGLLRPPPDPAALFDLNRLPALRELHVCEPLDGMDWRPATERAMWYHTLERLTVVGNGTEWTDGQLADIAGMPGLHAVAFQSVGLQDALAGLWEGQSFWRSVGLRECGLAPSDIGTVLPAGPLIACAVLDVSDNRYASAVLGWVGGAPCADELRVLRANDWDGPGGGWLDTFLKGRPLPLLAELDIGTTNMHGGMRMSPDPVRRLMDGDVCPRLVSLRLLESGAAAVAASPGSARLRELVFDGPLDKAAAKALAGSPHLDSLELLDARPADRAAGEILRDRFGRRVRLVGG